MFVLWPSFQVIWQAYSPTGDMATGTGRGQALTCWA